MSGALRSVRWPFPDEAGAESITGARRRRLDGARMAAETLGLNATARSRPISDCSLSMSLAGAAEGDPKPRKIRSIVRCARSGTASPRHANLRKEAAAALGDRDPPLSRIWRWSQRQRSRSAEELALGLQQSPRGKQKHDREKVPPRADPDRLCWANWNAARPVDVARGRGVAPAIIIERVDASLRNLAIPTHRCCR